MLIKKSSFLFAFFALLMVACDQPNTRPLLKKSDSLLTVLKGAEVSLESIDLQKLSVMVDTISYDARFINTQLEDTVEVDLAMAFDSYLLVKKSNNRIIKAVKDHKLQVLEAQNQIEDLSHDIEKGLLSLDTAQIYWNHEAKNVAQIKKNVDNLHNVAHRNDTAFQTLKPRVNDIIRRIKQRDGF